MHDHAACELADTGRTWLRNALSRDALEKLAFASDVGSKPGARFGQSTAFSSVFESCDALQNLLRSLKLSPMPVRLLAFNKSDKANWSVPWHQDRVIAVQHKKPVSGYAQWV